MGLELAGCGFVHRDNRLAMTTAVLIDMGDGLFE